MPQAYPLNWPVTWPRSTTRARSPFAARSVSKATSELLGEFRRLGVSEYNLIISTNLLLRNDGYPRSEQRTPADPGVAVYCKIKGKDSVLACDKWATVEDNLWAIAKHIEALRGQNRWGVGSIEQAFAGYQALPAPAVKKKWYDVLCVSPRCTLEEAQAAFRRRARDAHPDNGGTHEQMAEVNAAWADAKAFINF